jgi:hypothetical protein
MAMRFKKKTAPIVSFAILSSIVALAFMSADECYIAVPGLVCVILMVWLWSILWDRDQKIPFFDIGIFCALATFVYTVYPLANYWEGGLRFDTLSDWRLGAYNPLPVEMGAFHLRHVVYLGSFVIFYAGFRGKGSVEVGNVRTPSCSARQSIVLFFLLLTGYFFLLQMMTGANYNSSYESEAFQQNVTVFRELPLFLIQISSKLQGISFLFKLSLLFIVVSRYRQKKWRNILIVWLAAEIVQVLFIKGARSGLVYFLIATALFYHRMIKPLTMKFIITSGVILLVGFLFLGVYRSYDNVSEMKAAFALHGGTRIFSSANEFQALLGTAYHVSQMKEAGTNFPWYLYLNDIITILPPQQIMPFEKVAASEWYLRQIGLSGMGVGCMWGVISQSIAGFDWLELAFRGAILGFILAKFHRWYLKHQSGFMETLFYIFFCIKVYYTFRDTTFSPLTNLAWEVIPFYILLRVGAAILPRNTGRQAKFGIALRSHIIK